MHNFLSKSWTLPAMSLKQIDFYNDGRQINDNVSQNYII